MNGCSFLIHWINLTSSIKVGIIYQLLENEMNNLVHKHAHKFNRCTTFVDRKKAMKGGKVKHKGKCQ
jgi:hypothetical protein